MSWKLALVPVGVAALWLATVAIVNLEYRRRPVETEWWKRGSY